MLVCWRSLQLGLELELLSLQHAAWASSRPWSLTSSVDLILSNVGRIQISFHLVVQYTVYIIVWSNKASCIVATIRKKRRKRIKFDAKFPIRPGYKPRFIEDSKRIAFNKGGHNRKQERWRAMDISSHYYARGHKRRKLFLPISLIHILFFFIVKHEFM